MRAGQARELSGVGGEQIRANVVRSCNMLTWKQLLKPIPGIALEHTSKKEKACSLDCLLYHIAVHESIQISQYTSCIQVPNISSHIFVILCFLMHCTDILSNLVSESSSDLIFFTWFGCSYSWSLLVKNFGEFLILPCQSQFMPLNQRNFF